MAAIIIYTIIETSIQMSLLQVVPIVHRVIQYTMCFIHAGATGNVDGIVVGVIVIILLVGAVVVFAVVIIK